MAGTAMMSKASLASRPAVRCRTTRFVGTPLRMAAPSRAVAVARARFVVAAAVEKGQVLEDVRKIIAEQLGTDLDKVVPDSKFVDLGADSLDTVEIMMALEEKFGLTLDEEGAEKISTVQEAADLIAGQVNK